MASDLVREYEFEYLSKVSINFFDMTAGQHYLKDIGRWILDLGYLVVPGCHCFPGTCTKGLRDYGDRH